MTQEMQPGLGNNLEGWGWEGGGTEVQVGGDMGKPMFTHFHADVWEKPMQPCKAIILQLKINKFLKIMNHLSYKKLIIYL